MKAPNYTFDSEIHILLIIVVQTQWDGITRLTNRYILIISRTHLHHYVKKLWVEVYQFIMRLNPSGTDDVYESPSDRGHMTSIDASVPVFCARFLPPPSRALTRRHEGSMLETWLRCPPPPVTARNYLSTPSPIGLGRREAPVLRQRKSDAWLGP